VSVQRVGGAEVVAVAYPLHEALAVLHATTRYARQQERQTGARSPLLASAIERLRRELADPDADTASARPQRCSGHPDRRQGCARAASTTPGTRPVRSISTREAATQLGVSTRHVRRLVGRGQLDAVAADGRGTYRIDPASVAVLKARRNAQRGA